MIKRICVIFGGTGFIGGHLARYILENDLVEEVYLADIVGPRAEIEDSRTFYVNVDVRNKINSSVLPSKVDFIVNLAAVHREPGHVAHEYFETNLLGAQNVCAWAEDVGCNRIVFTSSIAPYGPSENIRTEESLPVPKSPYGSSKLVAEKIHIAWQNKSDNRKLVIVRPGVIFGAGERGNVTRLIQATIRKYFFFLGNKKTRKAGGYVKELVSSIVWALDKVDKRDSEMFLYNFTMDPPPTIEEYVIMASKVAGVSRFVPNIPHVLLYNVSVLVDLVARPLGINQPINPVRINKLVHSNNIVPGVLRREGYEFKYTLEEAMLDWKAECPQEWE